MFDQIAMASQALHTSVGLSQGSVVPALCGCPHCQTVVMIAGPTLGRCLDCDEDRTILVFDPILKTAMPGGSPLDLGLCAAA